MIRTDPEAVDESVEAPPVPERSGLILLFVLAGLLSLFMIAGVVGLHLHFQSNKAVRNEIIDVKEELRLKSAALAEVNVQIQLLSEQISALKENAIARSGNVEVAVKSATRSKSPAASPPPEKSETAHESALPKEEGSGRGGPLPDRKKDTESASKTENQPVSVPEPPPVAPPIAVPPREKRSPVSANRCDLVGKTMEEQQEILKRCVGLMNAEPERQGSRR